MYGENSMINWENIAKLKLYFYNGWQYIGIANSIIAILNLLIVYGISKNISFGNNIVIIAIMFTILLIISAIILGKLLFETLNRAENNINLKNSSNLNEKLDKIIKLLEERRINNMKYDEIELCDIFYQEHCLVKCLSVQYCTKSNEHILKCLKIENAKLPNPKIEVTSIKMRNKK
jgi:hypothetical protein